MFDRIKAFPDGTIEYYYKDRIVVEGKDKMPIIKRKYDKDLYGAIKMDNVLSGDFGKLSIN